MIAQQPLASVKRADRELHVREKVLNSAILGADISSGWEDILRFLRCSTPSRSRSATAARVARYLTGSGFAHSFSNSWSRFMYGRDWRPVGTDSRKPIHGDRADETHSAWSVDLIGVLGRTCQISWCTLRRWTGSRVVCERHYDHQQTGGPLTNSDLRVGLPCGRSHASRAHYSVRRISTSEGRLWSSGQRERVWWKTRTAPIFH